MTLIDLSHSIASGMPEYPGTEPSVIEKAASITEHGYAEKRITIHSHTATHVDAPAHVIAGGRSLDQFGLNVFSGPGCLIDITPGFKLVELTDLLIFEPSIAKSEFVLLHTGWSRYWGRPEYFMDYPVLSAAAVAWLSAFPLKGIGVDMASVDPVADRSLANHRALLARNILIIENLTNLAALPKDGFIFNCLPIKIADADGAPVRAAAFLP